MSNNLSDPPITLQLSISSLTKYKNDVLTYVHKATVLPLKREEYLDDLGVLKVPEQFENHVESILNVYQEMSRHCTDYENKTHPMIIESVSGIARYSSGVERVYSAICSTIVKMEGTSSQERSGDLDSLIDSNIKKITEFISSSREANGKLKDFRDDTWLDFNAADQETKKLDAEVRAYEEKITKESDSIEDTKRVIDKPSNTFSAQNILHTLLSKPKAWRQAKVSRVKLDHLTKIKEGGDAMKTHLQDIRNLADSAVKAIEELIGAFGNVSEQLKEIKEIVHTDLPKASSFVVEFHKLKLLERWKLVDELAREFMASAYLPEEKDV